MSALDNIRSLIVANDERLEEMATQYAGMLKDLVPMIVDFMKDNISYDGKLAVSGMNLAMIQELLQSAGMGEWGEIDQYLEASIGFAIDEMNEMMPEMEAVMRPSPAALEQSLKDVKEESKLDLANIERRMESTVFQQLLVMQVTPVSMKAATRALSTRMNTSRSLAYTYLNTATALQQRKVQQIVGKRLERYGEKVEYIYLGPNDGLTRPFCKAIVDKVFNEKQIRKLNNGQTGDVFGYGGGYNCRHRWVPTTGRIAKRYKHISMANNKTMEAANVAAGVE